MSSSVIGTLSFLSLGTVADEGSRIFVTRFHTKDASALRAVSIVDDLVGVNLPNVHCVHWLGLTFMFLLLTLMWLSFTSVMAHGSFLMPRA